MEHSKKKWSTHKKKMEHTPKKKWNTHKKKMEHKKKIEHTKKNGTKKFLEEIKNKTGDGCRTFNFSVTKYFCSYK